LASFWWTKLRYLVFREGERVRLFRRHRVVLAFDDWVQRSDDCDECVDSLIVVDGLVVEHRNASIDGRRSIGSADWQTIVSRCD